MDAFRLGDPVDTALLKDLIQMLQSTGLFAGNF